MIGSLCLTRDPLTQQFPPIFADVFQCPDSGSVGALWGASEQSRSYRDVVINGHRVDALVLNAYATSLEGLKSRLETRA
jgi:hypothetical protein